MAAAAEEVKSSADDAAFAAEPEDADEGAAMSERSRTDIEGFVA